MFLEDTLFFKINLPLTYIQASQVYFCERDWQTISMWHAVNILLAKISSNEMQTETSHVEM